MKLAAPLSWVLSWSACLALAASGLFLAIGAPAFDTLMAGGLIAAGAADAMLLRRRWRMLRWSRTVFYMKPDIHQWTRSMVFFLLPLALSLASQITGLRLLPIWLFVSSWALSCLIFFADMLFVLPPALAWLAYARLARRGG